MELEPTRVRPTSSGWLQWYDTVFSEDGWDSKCGGIVIARNAILTSAHCIKRVEDQRHQERLLSVVIGQTDLYDGRADPENVRHVTTAIMPKVFESSSSDGQSYNPHDIAILFVDTPIPKASIFPFQDLAPSDRECVQMIRGRIPSTVCGYRHEDKTTREVSGEGELFSGTMHPRDAQQQPTPSKRYAIFSFDRTRSNDANATAGDSGIPMISDFAGSKKVAGLTTSGTKDCNGVTRLRPYLCWIVSAAAYHRRKIEPKQAIDLGSRALGKESMPRLKGRKEPRETSHDISPVELRKEEFRMTMGQSSSGLGSKKIPAPSRDLARWATRS